MIHPSRFWSRLSGRLMSRYGHVIAKSIIAGAAAPAVMKLRLRKQELRILVDNSVLGHAITHETAWIDTGEKLWGGEIPIQTGYAARVPVYDRNNNSQVYRSITYIPGIAHLAEKGIVRLCTTSEMENERLDQPGGRFSGYGYFDLNLFGRVEFEFIDDGSYCVIGGGAPMLSVQRKDRLSQKDDVLFKELVRRLGEKHTQDAWHITAAHRNGLFCFLTMDFRLQRAFQSQMRHAPLSSIIPRIMTPEELGSFLGIRPVHSDTISHLHSNWSVRDDLSMPGQRRRPRAHYKRP